MRLLPYCLTVLQASVSLAGRINCDITNIGILNNDNPKGRWKYNGTFKFKFQKRNPSTGEKLQNKGRLKRSKGLFIHREAASDKDYSDGWFTCIKNKYASFHAKCYDDGKLEINGKMGSEITLPDCSEINLGCDSSTLGIYNTNSTFIEKCKKGYINASTGLPITLEDCSKAILETGVNPCLERHKNICRRTTNSQIKNCYTEKIRCQCDFTTRNCEYQKYSSEDKTWKKRNKEYVRVTATDECDPSLQDGSLYTIENVGYPGHRLAKWGEEDENMGTYDSYDILNDQVWKFQFDKVSGDWLIENHKHVGHKLAMWDVKNRNHSGTYSGDMSTSKLTNIS